LLSFALGDLITTMDREREAAKAEAVALDKDLALTAAVQGLLLPKKDAYESSALSLAGFYAPAQRCGGDWWWYEPLPDGRIVVLLGDVTGHGAGAAMVTAAVAAAYRAAPDRLRRGDVAGLLESLNANLVAICAGRHHMSFAAVEIDPSRLVAKLWTAGAPAVLVLRKGGTIVPLASSGRPLGEPELVIGAAEVQLERGDRIFVFSDGLPELSRSNGKQLGYRGVSRLLRGTSGRKPAEARQAIAAALRDDRSLEPQHDDITFVLIDLADPAVKQRAA
jgi:serine phosphatase RsbU (regulator of sigma subunit)